MTGGVVNYIRKDKAKSPIDMRDEYITVSHDIDFNRPGVYVVELKAYSTIACEFPVQVIELPKNTNLP